jgi:hypothetical protein
MKKYLQKLPFWPSGGKPGPAASVSEQRPNVQPTPEQDADELRREALRKDDRKLEERDEFPTRPKYEP